MLNNPLRDNDKILMCMTKTNTLRLGVKENFNAL